MPQFSDGRFTKLELMECANRELGMRRTVYPSRVTTGKMKQIDATKQIDMMLAIYRILAKLPDEAIAAGQPL